MSDNRGAAVASGDAAQLALQELVNEIIQELYAGDVEEKRLAQRLIGARKADSLTREQEAALANLAQASGASQPASLRRQAVPEEQAFCINLSSLTDSALEELAITVEEEQFLRTRRRMACRSASQPATDAPLVEDEQERRQALDGQWYTMEEFRQFYQKPYGSFSAWRRYWDQAVREAVPPGAASCAGSGDCA